MSARTVTVAVGVSLLLDGEMARVVEFDGRIVTVLLSDAGTAVWLSLSWLDEHAAWIRLTATTTRDWFWLDCRRRYASGWRSGLRMFGRC